MAGQKIAPSLWFDRDAVEAAHFYTSVFKNSCLGDITYSTGAGSEITGLKAGDVIALEFDLAGQRFIGINGGPVFKFNPSVSFLVACETKEEVDRIWKKLSGGPALMELGEYPFSPWYGWTVDKYGLSWQIMHMGERPVAQKITTTLMFVGKQAGRAEEAIKHYVSIFKNASIGGVMRYGKGEEPDKEGTVKHAGFLLEGQEFAAMDSALDHKFSFNEAISLLVSCENQKEIDYYWNKLTAGGEEGVCGWLKDKFGFSWQVTPKVLDRMLLDPDKARASRVMLAFLKMKKLDIAKLKEAYEG